MAFSDEVFMQRVNGAASAGLFFGVFQAGKSETVYPQVDPLTMLGEFMYGVACALPGTMLGY